jgi:tetratricopeptide (TPR) repeat protein
MKLSSVRSSCAAAFTLTALSGVALALGAIGVGCLPGALPAAYAAPPAAARTAAINDLTPEADSAIAQQNWAQALTQLDARIKTNPRDAQAKFKRATVLARMGRDEDAIAAFTELTQLYPELPEPYNNLAALYAKQGRYDDARGVLEVAVKANPSYGLAYENLGDLYLRMANAAYQRATDLGHAGASTRQRMADLQKIITPPPAAPHRRVVPAAQPVASVYTTAPGSTLNNPAFQNGGPSGSLEIPPYMAPSHQN